MARKINQIWFDDTPPVSGEYLWLRAKDDGNYEFLILSDSGWELIGSYPSVYKGTSTDEVVNPQDGDIFIKEETWGEVQQLTTYQSEILVDGTMGRMSIVKKEDAPATSSNISIRTLDAAYNYQYLYNSSYNELQSPFTFSLDGVTAVVVSFSGSPWYVADYVEYSVSSPRKACVYINGQWVNVEDITDALSKIPLIQRVGINETISSPREGDIERIDAAISTSGVQNLTPAEATIPIGECVRVYCQMTPLTGVTYKSLRVTILNDNYAYRTLSITVDDANQFKLYDSLTGVTETLAPPTYDSSSGMWYLIYDYHYYTSNQSCVGKVTVEDVGEETQSLKSFIGVDVLRRGHIKEYFSGAWQDREFLNKGTLQRYYTSKATNAKEGDVCLVPDSMIASIYSSPASLESYTDCKIQVTIDSGSAYYGYSETVITHFDNTQEVIQATDETQILYYDKGIVKTVAWSGGGYYAVTVNVIKLGGAFEYKMGEWVERGTASDEDAQKTLILEELPQTAKEGQITTIEETVHDSIDMADPEITSPVDLTDWSTHSIRLVLSDELFGDITVTLDDTTTETLTYADNAGETKVYPAGKAVSVAWTGTLGIVTLEAITPHGVYEYYDGQWRVRDYTNLAISAESTGNKVTSLSASSTDTEYPSAKCVYDAIGNIQYILSQI